MTNHLFRDDVAMPVPECGQLLTASRAPGPIASHHFHCKPTIWEDALRLRVWLSQCTYQCEGFSKYFPRTISDESG
jgi:hypothetical protein